MGNVIEAAHRFRKQERVEEIEFVAIKCDCGEDQFRNYEAYCESGQDYVIAVCTSCGAHYAI